MQKTGWTLAQLLAPLTKDYMQEIRKSLNIKNASQLSKAELVERLAEEIPSRVDSVIPLLDELRCRILTQAMNRKNGLTYEDLFKAGEFDYGYFQKYGWLLPSPADGRLAVPLEVRPRLEALSEASNQKIIRRNTEWGKLVKGMLYYYGYADLQFLWEKAIEYTKQDISFDTFKAVIFEFARFDEGVIHVKSGIAHYMADKGVLEEHEFRPQLPYAPLTKGQVLQAADDDFAERNDRYRRMAAFLTAQCGMTPSEADFLTGEIVLDFKRGLTPNEMIEDLQEELDLTIELLTSFVDLLIPLYNGSRQWALKGHSPEGMGQMAAGAGAPNPPAAPLMKVANPMQTAGVSSSADNVYSLQTKQKIGRNDPCPCGSGKKYKKCCGA